MGDEWFEAWLDLMQVRTPVEQAINLWADWCLTVRQAALHPFEMPLSAP